MKHIITLACAVVCIGALAHDSSYDALYTAATGYVTLDANDSGNGANSSFHSAKGWSDKDVPPNYGVPHAGTNYYVKAGKTLHLDWVTSGSPTGFAGDSIVVGGQVQMNGAYGSSAICGPLTMLPDSDFHWLTVGNVVGGSVHVKGTGTSTVKPVFFRSGRSGDTTWYSVNALMKFSSDADGELYWKLESGRNIGVTLTVLDDWSGFPGTFRIGRNHTFKTQNGHYQMPGNLIITTNATLQLTASTGQSEIGALTIQTNGVLNLSANNGSQTVRISKKLELEPGALVIPQLFGDANRIAAQEFHPVFELTAEAVAAGLPDFSSLPVPICGRTQSLVNGHEPVLSIFPALEWAVRDAEGDGKTVGFSCKETVAVTNHMNYGGNGFIVNGTGAADPAKFWADGQYPQKGKGYYNKSKNLVLQGAGRPYVFPGDSFMLNAGAFAIYHNSGDVTISNLVLCGNGRFRLMSSGSTYHLRGTIRTLRKDASPAFRFNGGDRCTQFIDSDISGDGLLRFTMDTEVATASYDTTLPVGTFELTGDNSAFSGKMQVDCWQTVPYSDRASKFDPAFQPGPYSNITLRVSSQANLGGALPEVTYDALTISNECRLTLLSTAEFNEPTRGWFFPANAYLKVEDGAVATVTSPITYGTKLVKEGVGTLMLGGTPAVASGVAGRPQVKVDGGSVGFVSSTAIAGLDVDFSAGTSLRVLAAPSDAGLAERGVDLTDASITSESAIPVKVDMTGVVGASGNLSAAICTIPEASMPAYENLFVVGKVAPGYAAALNWVSNPDSTKTLRAEISKKGFLLSIR